MCLLAMFLQVVDHISADANRNNESDMFNLVRSNSTSFSTNEFSSIHDFKLLKVLGKGR